ncbi:MAG: T9SS type A sorting domain-containing protein [Bacteroidetes bacterium]|nr:T9SS type A sorting domain-containing protein [Bacteroidota bacterium]
MKKLFLLIAAGSVVLGANAQSSKKVSHVAPERQIAKVPGAIARHDDHVNYVHHGKATLTQIGATTTFGSGPGLPAGWTSGNAPSTAPVNWKWINTANTNYIDLNSASANDGWVVCDINDNPGSLPVDAYLTSPSFNFSGHAHVGMVFTEYYDRFEDSCYVDVNNGAGWVSYPVNFNNTLRPNDQTDNASDVLLNISATASNQSSVQIRFHFKGSYQGYEWHVDDLKFVDLDPVSNMLERSAHVYKAGTAEMDPLGTMPVQLFTSATPYTFLSNNGYNAQTNVSVTSNMVAPAGAPSYSQTVTKASLPVNAFDSVVSYAANPYTSTVTGTYKNGFAAGSATDTASFALTNTSWVQARPSFTAHGYYMYKASAPQMSLEYTTFFTVPKGKSDTLTSFNVSLYDGAGQPIEVQLYTYDGSNYTPVAGGAKTLAASDVSNNSIIWSSDIAATGANPGPIVLDGGTNDSFGQTYYAVVKTAGATQETVLWCADAPAFPAQSYFGLQAFEDTSDNLPNSYALAAHTVYAQTPVPLIRLNFDTYLGVKELVSNIALMNAFPNPANNKINIPFKVQTGGDATITVTNAAGQVVKSQVKHANANEYTTVEFSTSDLASGTYFYSVDVDGKRSSDHFVVTH